MLERDYLTRLFAVLAAAIRRSIFMEKNDPRGAADTLEEAISAATDIDGAILLSLAPESMSSVLQVSGVAPKVCGYIAHTLLLESQYLEEAKDEGLAGLRRQQAEAIAEAYGVDLDTSEAEIDDLVNRHGDDEVD